LNGCYSCHSHLGPLPRFLRFSLFAFRFSLFAYCFFAWPWEGAGRAWPPRAPRPSRATATLPPCTETLCTDRTQAPQFFLARAPRTRLTNAQGVGVIKTALHTSDAAGVSSFSPPFQTGPSFFFFPLGVLLVCLWFPVSPQVRVWGLDGVGHERLPRAPARRQNLGPRAQPRAQPGPSLLPRRCRARRLPLCLWRLRRVSARWGEAGEGGRGNGAEGGAV